MVAALVGDLASHKFLVVPLKAITFIDLFFDIIQVIKGLFHKIVLSYSRRKKKRNLHAMSIL